MPLYQKTIFIDNLTRLQHNIGLTNLIIDGK